MIETSIWHFRAEADPTRIHTVTRTQGNFICTCPVYAYGRSKDCRHMRLVKNGLAGLPVNEEPELAWAAVEHVQKYRGKVLVPFFRDDNQESMYLILWELRQLGISKRVCCEFMAVRGVSDSMVESFLKEKGLISDGGVVVPETEEPSAPRIRFPTTVEAEEVATG